MTSRHGPRPRGAASVSLRAPRRALYAFGLGLALSVVGLAALGAGARGNFIPYDAAGAADAPATVEARAERSERPARTVRDRISFLRFGGYAAHHRHEDDDEDYRPRHRSRHVVEDEEYHPRRHARHQSTVRASVIHFAALSPTFSGSQPVCVRLCDGFFFPLPTAAGDVASQGQACNSLCPDAPTDVFYRNGAENIEDSVSASGKLYSALPVSLRYRSASDETCSCHRNGVAYAPLKDKTLRRGDAIMTPAGFMVFRGVEGVPHKSTDFSALDGAGLGSGARGALQAIERASIAPAHPTLKDWLLSQNAPGGGRRQAAAIAPTQIAMRGPSNWRAAAAAGGGKIELMTWQGQAP